MSDLFYRTLFRDLAGLLDMAPFEPNAAGVCELMLNRRMPLTLVCDDENSRLLLIGLVNLPKSFPAGLLLSAALNPLHTAGPGIGVDQATGLCMAWQILLRQTLSAGQVFNALQALVAWVEQWEKKGLEMVQERAE